MTDALSYRHCPTCQAEVPVERRFPKVLICLLVLMALSFLLTALFFPGFIFLFIFLPFGFRFWRRREHCGVCGRSLPRSHQG